MEMPLVILTELMTAINLRRGAYDGGGYEDRERRKAMKARRTELEEHFAII